MQPFVPFSGSVACRCLPALLLSCNLFVVLTVQAQAPVLQTPFERDTLYSASREEAMEWYRELARMSPLVRVEPFGLSDGMLPLEAVIIGQTGTQNPAGARAAGKAVVLVNNAIHAGESCGVDASMLLSRKLATDPAFTPLLDHAVIVMIPYYNADGGRVRSPYFRANQQGPRLQGFRANARHYDLNRDFIKADTRNTVSFYQLFQAWDPDLFVDTHTSNGADYVHTLSLITTQADKLPPALSGYLRDTLEPWLYEAMDLAGWPMCPYVHGDHPPEQGLRAFQDLPRYSTGYAALFQCPGFMTEAHMLKPFADRVRATQAFLEAIVHYAAGHKEDLQRVRRSARHQARDQQEWGLRWEPDSNRTATFPFRGYTARTEVSRVTGKPGLRYDRTSPWSAPVPWWPACRPTLTVQRPAAYVIPQEWTEVLSRLQMHNVTAWRVQSEMDMPLTVYRIGQASRLPEPYEGRNLIVDVEVSASRETVRLFPGDVVIPTDQDAVAYLMHTLEPQAPDSWLAWNFFDAVLQQKEYFSAYVFEETAERMLEADPGLKAAFDQALHADPGLAADPRRQLDWLYRHSPWYEPNHRRYPVFRLERRDSRLYPAGQ